jgi:hypothetical protein
VNAVEIESAVSDLALQTFDREAFPYAFLQAFGNKDTAIKRLRTGNNNASDIPDGVLQRNNIHLAVCDEGLVNHALKALRLSPETAKAKAKFILATDGLTIEAEDLIGGETVACAFTDFPNHFGFFLPLAGISTIKEIKDNPIDVRATSRLNKLYIELLKENPDWAKDERRADMNHFMARLVFCFFAEDTDIFSGSGLFTKTLEQVTERDGSNMSEVLSTIFRAMNVKLTERTDAEPRLPAWANAFPYVNGGLFSGSTDVPKFTRMARTYLQHAGGLNWKKINPDIFGSMIQAVADDEERGSLGMHYTSVPNILKVLNPLFLDELREQLDEAGSNERKLLNLRKRMARIRVFDPACGSGNFLVIAYKQMREIEAEINRRRNESSFTNFRGIELRDFPAEIARLALIIAEFQCDVLYSGQKEALAKFLPLDAQNWIVCGNALRLDWLSICPPTGTGVKLIAGDLFGTPLDQSEIDFVNEGGETFICGNPPYLGSTWQTADQKAELQAIFSGLTNNWKSLDYVAGWFIKAADYNTQTRASSAFVSTNSICQGQQVPILWPLIFRTKNKITFAHTSFKWTNLASHNAGVTVAIIAMACLPRKLVQLRSVNEDGTNVVKNVDHINAYLVAGPNIVVNKLSARSDDLSTLDAGGKPVDGGALFLSASEMQELKIAYPQAFKFMRRVYGASEYIRGEVRYCLWMQQGEAENAKSCPIIATRLAEVIATRLNSPKLSTRKAAAWPHRFDEIKQTGNERVMIVPTVSSETREYLPVGLLPSGSIVTNLAFALFDAPLWNMALIASRIHLVWIGTVCGKMKTDFRYSNTLGWNTFPVPLLTDQNKADLTACAENVLLAREAHFPETIADLYDPETMPENLRHAHERNDEVLERIYIGRRFKNDTERLEKLFELYTKMTSSPQKPAANKKTARGKIHG